MAIIIADPAAAAPRTIHQEPGGLTLELEERVWPGGETVQPADRFLQVLAGRLDLDPAAGASLRASPRDAVLVPQGWRGSIASSGPARTLSMQVPVQDIGRAVNQPHCLAAVPDIAPARFADWGDVPGMIEGRSRTAGLVLFRRENGRSECGIWSCTPGTWRCEVASDELCWFFAGSSTYVRDDGATFEIRPGTFGYFPAGWAGHCRVHETVVKSYMIR